MILAIGNSGSYEVAAFNSVLEELKKNGEEAVLFKQDKCLDGEYLVFESNNGVTVYNVIIDGKEYNIDSFSAIWYMKPHLPLELMEFEPAKYQQFIQRQFIAMRKALWYLFKDKKWIDDPIVIDRAENKIFQLTLAEKAGLLLPDTLITSDPDRIRKFYVDTSGDLVVKLLGSSPMVNEVIFTNVVTPEYMVKIDSVKMSPSIFQRRILKAYELRITIVGDKIFPIKIYSQGDEQLELDWRRKPKLNDFEAKMELTSLPSEVEKKLVSFMKLIGLRFGCIDMIVTPDGEYVFLEINPNGQWYFIQLRIEVEIAKAIATLLL
ncbi:hypothetical protein GW933_00170 [Candidatus Falkowbacteria bacterium]|uniref:ATP-grasp domain-containing protein n=1 Tax=Candidatus Buchananbacteria bacterium CG10_big_fil_rev_8_21_14_0_10_33_19 TaxID=1974525 RepID=A0A2H0W2U7_9BACT|nr:hypothetical protein [Candidatus Falkowbacteria bacterium]PIS05673.1 MAG: hypothetical protein COT80_02795 [Candidatus Buchananbacteria bacterium CG10_big_fil_rev_8_21_14_0_10_33_19]